MVGYAPVDVARSDGSDEPTSLMRASACRGFGRRIPLFRWAWSYPRRALRGDVTAGVTVAVLLIPQSLAYAALAGMPPITGLYTSIAASVAYAALGTSRVLAVGPVALTALLSAAALGPLAEPGGQRYVELAGLLALLVGTLHLAMRILRLAALVNFLSSSVLSGFTAAAAIVIASTQIKDLLGIPMGAAGQSLVDTLRILAPRLGETNPGTFMMGSASLAVLYAGRRLWPNLPIPLLLLLGATSLSTWLQLEQRGIAVLREVPAGLPRPRLPISETEAVLTLLPMAAAVALVSFVEAISNAKTQAARSRESIDPGQELVAVGASNLAAAFLGGFPAGGSFSRTALAVQAGARTQLSGLVVAAVVLVVVLFFTPLLYPLPRASLAAIVVFAVMGLIDLREIRRTWRVRHVDGLAVIVTFVATLVLGVGPGVGAGVGFSLLAFIYRSANPRIAELGRVEGTTLFRDVRRHAGFIRVDPAVVILRMDAPLYFANAKFLADRVARLLALRKEVRHVLLDASAMADVDADGARTLQALYHELRDAGVALHLVTMRGYVRDVVGRAGLWQTLLDDNRVWSDVAEALSALDLHPHSPLRFGVADEQRGVRRVV